MICFHKSSCSCNAVKTILCESSWAHGPLWRLNWKLSNSGPPGSDSRLRKPKQGYATNACACSLPSQTAISDSNLHRDQSYRKLPGWLLQVTGVRHAMTEPGPEGGAQLGPGRGGSTMKSQWQMRGCAGWAGPLAKPAWTWATNLSALALEAQVLLHAAVCSRLVL